MHAWIENSFLNSIAVLIPASTVDLTADLQQMLSVVLTAYITALLNLNGRLYLQPNPIQRVTRHHNELISAQPNHHRILLYLSGTDKFNLNISEVEINTSGVLKSQIRRQKSL